MGIAIDQVVRVNGVTYGWNSSVFQFEGQQIEGIVQCDWDEQRERAKVWAARRDGKPVARVGGGKYTPPTFKIKMLKDTWEVIKTTILATLGLGSSGDAVFDFSAQVVEEEAGIPVITANASQCVVEKVSNAASEGAEARFVEVEISSLDFIENGIPLWSIERAI